MKKKTDRKRCPFYDENCLREKCQLFNEMLNNCEIHLVSYNLYLLSRVIDAKMGAKD